MAKDPAFLFYPSDFMIGTAFFSHEQRGKYISLLCYQHQLGHLTEQQMVDVCGGKDEMIFKKFRMDKKGCFFNEKLEFEKKRRSNFVRSRVKSRSYGKQRTCDVRGSYVERMETETVTETISNKTQKTKAVYTDEFEKIWSQYPSPVGKKDAFRFYKITVATDQDRVDIWTALNNYKSSERVSNGYKQDGDRWFRNWKDWIILKQEEGSEWKTKSNLIRK